MNPTSNQLLARINELEGQARAMHSQLFYCASESEELALVAQWKQLASEWQELTDKLSDGESMHFPMMYSHHV